MNYIADVLRVHCADGTVLEASLKNKQWGMEEIYYRIGGKDSVGTMRWYWPRINDNIALRGNWISNSGADAGILVTDAGLVSFPQDVGISLGAGNKFTIAIATDVIFTYSTSNADILFKTRNSCAAPATVLQLDASADVVRFPMDTGITVGSGNDLAIILLTNGVYIKNVTQDKDILFNINDGGADSTALLIDGSENNVYIPRAAHIGATTGDPGDNNLQVDGDIFTTAWTDWSSSVVATGWAATPTKRYYYKKVGKTLHIKATIDGTSNATTARMTVPFALYLPNSASNDVLRVCTALDNGGSPDATPGLVTAYDATTLSFFRDFASTVWTNSGAKVVVVDASFELA